MTVKPIPKLLRAAPAVIATALVVAASNMATAQELAKKKPLKAIEAYFFVLPAIDCHRTTTVKITINDKALDRLTATAMDNLSDSQLPEIKKAAARGASNYDKMVASVGKQGYCAKVFKEYGPSGTVARGLVVARRG